MNDLVQTVVEPRRQAILQLIWKEERTAGDIASAFDVSFSAVSQHLARLREAGAVTVRRDGRRRFYRAQPDAMGPVAGFLESLWRSSVSRLRDLAEAEARTTRKSRESR